MNYSNISSCIILRMIHVSFNTKHKKDQFYYFLLLFIPFRYFQMMSKLDNSNLFQVFQRGQRRISSARSSAILLVGAAKAGTSTVFNYIRRKPMKVIPHLIQPHFQNTSQADSQANVAQISDYFASATVCPNVADISDETSMIDMPSFFGKRNYIGEISSAYFFKVAFEALKEVKFIIVIDKNKLVDGSCDGIVNTFTQFLNLFNIQMMSQDIRKMFYTSIALVITKAEKNHQYLLYLGSILQMLRSPLLCFDNKKFVTELIQSLISNNHVQCFFSPKIEQNYSTQSHILDNLSLRPWSFLNLAHARQINRYPITANPLKDLHSRLNQDERTKAMSAIRDRIQNISKCLRIFKTLNNCIGNYSFKVVQILKYNNQETLQINFTQVFQEMKAYLQKNNVYDNQLKIKSGHKFVGKNISFLNQWHITLYIQQFIHDISSIFGEFQEKVQLLWNHLVTLINYLRTHICSSPQESFLFEKLTFVLKRGFKQFSMIYQFHPQEINRFYRNIVDRSGSIVDALDRNSLGKLVFDNIDWRVLIKHFKDKQKIGDYELFVNYFIRKYRSDESEEPYVKKQYAHIEIVKAKLSLQNNLKEQSVFKYITACEYLSQSFQQMQSNQWIWLKIASILKNHQIYKMTKYLALAKYIFQKNQDCDQNAERQIEDKDQLLNSEALSNLEQIGDSYSEKMSVKGKQIQNKASHFIAERKSK